MQLQCFDRQIWVVQKLRADVLKEVLSPKELKAGMEAVFPAGPEEEQSESTSPNRTVAGKVCEVD